MAYLNQNWYIKDIIIDSHEKDRGIRAYNDYLNKYSIDISPLKYGDYLFNTNDGKQVIFEYKTCKDFINSMENKSLFNEVSNQSIHMEYSYLIIVGDFDETIEELYFTVDYYRYKYKSLRKIKINLTNQINGALNRLYAMYVPIVFVENEKIAFKKMLEISLKIADNKKYGGIVRPSRKDLVEDNCALFLTTTNGIGEKKAKNITNELDINCLDDLCKMKPSDFASVTKITNDNVIEIWKKIHNEDINIDDI